jgi:hypothetical protein
MKRFVCGLGAGLVGLVLLSVMGCSNENEAAINEQAAKSSEADIKDPTQPTTNPADAYKNQQNPYTKAGGYPGAKK